MERAFVAETHPRGGGDALDASGEQGWGQHLKSWVYPVEVPGAQAQLAVQT